MNNTILEKLWELSKIKRIQSEFVIYPKDQKVSKTDLFENSLDQLVLEIGSGWGEFGIELAKQNPNMGILLIEKKTDRIKKTIKEIQKYSLKNIKILPLNVNWFFDNIFENQMFSKIIMNFPDPWPKKRHWKHRTLQEPFLKSILNYLEKNGVFYFATDYGPYARKVISLLRNFRNQFSWITNEWDFKRDNMPVSYFEQIKKESGSKLYYINRRKN